VATLDERIDSITYRVRVYSAGGCYSEDDITVRVYKTAPDILVPSAFTPNGDGRNDVLRPVALGITGLHYFRVYNRWGQIVFFTSEMGKGWDGLFNGTAQPSGTYIYAVEGTDFRGRVVFRKGTSVLIR
jgi:gliding motility-associated-like protein